MDVQHIAQVRVEWAYWKAVPDFGSVLVSAKPPNSTEIGALGCGDFVPDSAKAFER
jgi:hypothetical protein